MKNWSEGISVIGLKKYLFYKQFQFLVVCLLGFLKINFIFFFCLGKFQFPVLEYINSFQKSAEKYLKYIQQAAILCIIGHNNANKLVQIRLAESYFKLCCWLFSLLRCIILFFSTIFKPIVPVKTI